MASALRTAQGHRHSAAAFMVALGIAVACLLAGMAGAPSAQAAANYSCSVQVTNIASGTELYVDQSKALKVKTKVTPANKKVKTLISYASSNTAAVSIDEAGVFTTLAHGKATLVVTVTFKKGGKTLSTKQASVKVKVLQQVTGVKLSGTTTLYMGSKSSSKSVLAASVSPKNASDAGLVWTSSDESVATVTAKGKVKPVSFGTAKITAKAADGQGAKDKVKVTVLPLSFSGVIEIAHRGVSAQAPENTLAAYRLAIEQGFDGIECDVWEVQPNADGTPGLAIMHDRDLERMCGSAYAGVSIQSLTVAELQQIPIIGGANVSAYETQYIPSLDQYLDLFTGNSMIPCIEVKGRNYVESGAISQEAANVIVSKIAERGLGGRAMVISYNWTSLERIHTAMKNQGLNLRTVAIINKSYYTLHKDDLIPSLVELGVDGVSCNEALGTAQFAQQCKDAGLTFTVHGVTDVGTLGYYVNEVGLYSIGENQHLAWGA